MTLGLDRTETAIINAIPSLPIHSSVLIVLVAGLFLAALVIRAQRMAGQAPSQQETQGLSGRRARSVRKRAERGRRQKAVRRERRANMTVTTQKTFTVHWGRTLVALIGLLSLLTVLVTGVLAATGAVLVTAPLVSAGVFVLSLLTLRSMAVVRRRRRRRQRIEAAMREAMDPQASAASQQSRPGTVEHRDATPFNALSAQERAVGSSHTLVESEARSSLNRLGENELSRHSAQSSTQRPFAQQLDEDGLPVDVERTFAEAPGEQRSHEVQQSREDQHVLQAAVQGAAQGPPRVTGGWEPREIPKPKYLEAEKAERVLPEPLVPEEPKPSSDVRLSQTVQVAPPQAPSEAAQNSEKEASRKDAGQKKQHAMDLDEVLKRRRA